MTRWLTAIAGVLAVLGACTVARAAQDGPGVSARPGNCIGAAAMADPACAGSTKPGSAPDTDPAPADTAARDAHARTAVALNVLDFGARCDGSTDDWAAFQAALDLASGNIAGSTVLSPAQKRSAGPAERGIVVPPGVSCVIGRGLAVNFGGDRTLSIASHGLHGAKLLFPAGFNGTGLAVRMSGASTAADAGFAFSVSGLEFMRAGVDTGGTALSVTTTGGGAAIASIDARDLVFDGAGGGSFATGLELLADNITTVSNIYCGLGFHGVCVQYDTPGQISVEHHLSDIYVNGSGATGIGIGHAGLRGPLQGFTIRGLSCTGTDHCLIANGAPTAIDEIVLEGSQLSARLDNIQDNGGDTLIVIGNYFLGGARGIDARNMNRLVVSGNTFYLGPPAVGKTNNLSIYTTNLGGGPASGSVITGNLFTNLYGVPVYLDRGTDHVLFGDNECLGNDCIVDASGNRNNLVGLNHDGGELAARSMAHFKAGLSIDGDGPIGWRFTGDGVGNARLSSTLGSGAGALEIGPNSRLDGQVVLANPMTPAGPTAPCAKGQLGWDNAYVYVCIAANRWKRSALSGW